MKESPEIAAEFSFEKEKVIAKSFSQRFQWEMILIGIRAGSHMAFSMAISTEWFARFMGGILNRKSMCMLCLFALP